MNINPLKFEELIKKGYSLDVLYMLNLVKNQVDVFEMCSNSVKISAIYETMKRKLLISDEGNITLSGEALLKFMEGEEVKIITRKEKTSNDFDEWWKIFPPNNKFEYKGITFQPSRSFKVKKEDCRKLFDKIINEKEFTAEEIIEATKYDIFLKKENSVKKRENQLTFLQNSHTYLYQRSFQGFVDLIKENGTTNLEVILKGYTDI